METFRHEFEKRSIFECLQLRMLPQIARRRSNESLRFGWNSIICDSFRDLIEQPVIDRAAQWHEVSALVGQQRFAKKFPHFSIDLARPEIVVVEKNLEASGGNFVIVGKGDERFFVRSEGFGRSRQQRQNLGCFLREGGAAETTKACQQAGIPKFEFGNEITGARKLHWAQVID